MSKNQIQLMYKQIKFATESILERNPGKKSPSNNYGFEDETIDIKELVVLLFLFIEHIYEENMKLRTQIDSLRGDIFALKIPVERLRFKYKVV